MKKLPVITPICCAPAIAPVSPEIAERLASQFKALADPTRVGIVNRLAAASEVCVCDLTSVFDLSQPTVSHHLKVLRDAGLVDSERRGLWAYYYVIPDTLEELAAWLT